MKRKALSLMLCMTMILTVMPFFSITASADIEPILAYVPLDNRTVNVDRVIYEAESAGFKVMMPDEDLYATRLDGQPLNANGKPFGDSQKLLDWILEADEVTDYFVISLDQLLSGGLVNSRSISSKKYDKEFKIIDAIIDLSKENHVYLIDTVARLATCTVGYQNATLETYNYLRQYNIAPRYVLKENVLTVSRIVAGYKRSADYKEIPINSTYAKEVKNSLHTRERKLNLIDYILTKDTSGQIKYFVGIDDSNPENTIQTNEVNYIRKTMGDRGLVYSGTDELGMMAVLSLMIDYYGYTVNAAAVYFGDTEKSSSGSVYDMETVQENIEKHIESIGVQLTDKETADLEIVVLTSPAQAILSTKYVSRMIDYINDNISKGIPTIVINSAPGAYSGNLEYRMIRECEMSMLLSYSSWGTVGNSIGLALCNGISRYLYLHSRDNSTDAADIAFLKGLTFSYEKDISYLRGGGKTLFNDYLTAKGWSTSNFYQSDEQVKTVNADLEELFKTAEYNVTVDDIIDNLTGCRYFKGLGGECGIIGEISLSNYSAPFFRTYEIRFDIDVDLRDITINGFSDGMVIDMPYNPADGQLTYSFTLYYMDESGKVQKVPSTYDKGTGKVKFTTDKLPGFFTSTLNIESAKAHSLFTDVPESSWYFDDVLYVYEKGLMRGTTDGKFEPNVPMTRAMLVHVLNNMAGSTYEMPQGTEGPITREALANILWQYAKDKGQNVNKGSEPGIDHYADIFSISQDMRDGFDWACRTGIITGTSDERLLPKALVTRAEVAVILKRFLER